MWCWAAALADLNHNEGFRAGFMCAKHTHGPLSSSCLGLPYRILTMSHKKELLRGLWVLSEALDAFLASTMIEA